MCGICCLTAVAPSALAAPPRPAVIAQQAPTAAQKEAEAHYLRARELYKQGSYREAIVELEAALALDPDAKDLVFNLGVVHEKLANIDDAIRYFKRYSQMDLSPAERERCDAYLKRLEGAKKELDAKLAAQRAAAERPAPPPAPPPPPPRGRVDALTVGAAAVGIVGLSLGTFFAVKATSDRPPASGYVTGRDGSYDDLARQADDAHSSAIKADLFFVVGVGGTVAAALLYFLRPRHDPAPRRTGQTLSVGAGSVLVQGSF
jgi:tetratricopeptide (TPR) repeat protein